MRPTGSPPRRPIGSLQEAANRIVVGAVETAPRLVGRRSGVTATLLGFHTRSRRYEHAEDRHGSIAGTGTPSPDGHGGARGSASVADGPEHRARLSRRARGRRIARRQRRRSARARDAQGGRATTPRQGTAGADDVVDHGLGAEDRRTRRGGADREADL